MKLTIENDAVNSYIIVTQYPRIPCIIRTVGLAVHVCYRFDTQNSCSCRLRLVTGFTDRTKETRKLCIQENEIGNEIDLRRVSVLGPQNAAATAAATPAATYTGNTGPD